MNREPNELYEREQRQAEDELMIATGEFVALFASGLLTLGLLFGTQTLASAARGVVLATVTSISAAATEIEPIGSSMEARANRMEAGASENRVVAKHSQ
jgi:hypothetical protein